MDREHYFPKSKYPALALHSLNLVLTCRSCNQVAHRDVDPVPEHRPGSICDVYVPYVRSGLDDIDLGFERDSKVVTLESREDPDRTRVERLNALYHLDEQWSDRLQRHIHDEIVDCIIGRLGHNPSEDCVLDELATQMGICERGQRRRPNYFLKLHYLQWLTHNVTFVLRDLEGRTGDPLVDDDARHGG